MKSLSEILKKITAVTLSVCMCTTPVATYAEQSREMQPEAVSISSNDAFDDILESTESYVDEDRDYSTEHIIVVMKKDGINTLQTESNEEVAKSGGEGELALACEEIKESLEGVGEFQFSTVEISDNITVEDAVDYYGGLPGVAFAQPDYLIEPETEIEETKTDIKTESISLVNDPKVGLQWYLEKLNMDTVWKYTEEFSFDRIRVAIVDTGLDVTHPDLQRAVNRDLCVSSVNSNFDKISSDLGATGHGTHIAGIIGATADNGIGVAGIASDRVELMAIRCQAESGIYSSYAARGVEYAVNHGARIINMSLGTTSSDNLLKASMQYAYSQNVLVVCSAGNTGSGGIHYPSGYDETIGIIAVDQQNQKLQTSNYGEDNYISAPGNNIYSTLPNGRYGYMSGTSMAAGVVSGVAAYILSLNSGLTVEELKSVLAKTADDIYDQGFDVYSGWGVINPYNAITSLTANSNTISGFVNRLYQLIMQRTPDAEGLDYWINLLEKKEDTGAGIAQQFIESPEFVMRKISDEQYVTVLYRVFMGRNPETDGYNYWMRLLANGISRSYVANQFCESAEFGQICSRCGIVAGTMVLRENRDQNEGLTFFIARQYTKVLGRKYDIEGINYWTGEIIDGKYSIMDVCADEFFHSQEFYNRNLTEDAYIKVLYQTFFDREYDKDGLAYWKEQLATGSMSRDQILNSFASSEEFRQVRSKYGF